MSMDVKEQERTYRSFGEMTKYSVIAIVILLVLMAAFLA